MLTCPTTEAGPGDEDLVRTRSPEHPTLPRVLPQLQTGRSAADCALGAYGECEQLHHEEEASRR